MTLQQISEATGIGASTLSELFNGKQPCGKRTAVKLEAATGKPFNLFMAMPPAEIEAELRAALETDNPAAA